MHRTASTSTTTAPVIDMATSNLYLRSVSLLYSANCFSSILLMAIVVYDALAMAASISALVSASVAASMAVVSDDRRLDKVSSPAT